jgi:hypothetical protein
MTEHSPKKEATDVTDGMSPEDHLRQAAEYEAIASGTLFDKDDRPCVWDNYTARTVEVASRMATLHLQFASTKSLLEATSSARLAESRRAAKFHVTGSVTGRLPEKLPEEELLMDRPELSAKGFTMAQWRAIKADIEQALSKDGRACIAVPYSSRFLYGQMDQVAARWARENSVAIRTALAPHLDPGREPWFVADVLPPE